MRWYRLGTGYHSVEAHAKQHGNHCQRHVMMTDSLVRASLYNLSMTPFIMIVTLLNARKMEAQYGNPYHGNSHYGNYHCGDSPWIALSPICKLALWRILCWGLLSILICPHHGNPQFMETFIMDTLIMETLARYSKTLCMKTLIIKTFIKEALVMKTSIGYHQTFIL
jgi:hypothetical protein